ncbi:hypothetical protein ROHU_030534 [Labeo rohita]|uniref:Uncharacterized protein n=1 Tax=Labeo rohita TaxID=84645 RepID=A0A498LV67_LABRO|nr:hypothetical protein ROHU_030534 [Labeo rohita]
MPELSVFTTMKTELPFSATMQANCYGCSTPVIGTPMVSLPPQRILDLNCRSMISIQCTENPQGRDGIVLFDTEAFPMVSILCPISVEDLPDRSS